MSAILFGSPWAALKSWAGVTPGLSRTNVGPPAGSPVTVDTTLTPPDSSAPPTVIVFPFIFTVITGRAVLCPVRAAGAVWAASAVPPGMARDRPAATRAAVMLLRIAGSPFQGAFAASRAPMRGLADSVHSARMRTPDRPGTWALLRTWAAGVDYAAPAASSAPSQCGFALTKPHDRRRSPLPSYYHKPPHPLPSPGLPIPVPKTQARPGAPLPQPVRAPPGHLPWPADARHNRAIGHVPTKRNHCDLTNTYSICSARR